MLEKIICKTRCVFFPCEENKYRPKILDARFLYYYAILLLAFKVALIPILLYLPASIFFADLTKTSLIELANESRQSLGVAPLKESAILDEAAYLKAKDILEKDYFAHNSPEGITPWFWFDAAGYNYRYAGENLAIGFVESEEVNQAWLDSPSHRENILKKEYSEIGLAVLTGDFQGRETTVVVQLFGSPMARLAITETSPPEQISENVISVPPENVAPAQEENVATQTEPANTEIAQNSQPGQVLSSFKQPAEEKGFMFSFLNFLTSDYYDLLQKIIYGSLALIFALLLITVFFDIFIYHAYEIQYKDILFKTVGFYIILAALLLIDKETIIQIIPHNLGIY